MLVGHDLEDTVVEREHVVAAGLVPPQRDQLGDLLGVLGGEVVHLGDVLGHVVELPHVVVERRVRAQAVVVERADRVEGHRLPAVVVDRPRAEHLEVLGEVTPGRVGAIVAEEVGEAGAVEVRLGDAVDRRGRIDADELQHGREDVDGVGELAPDATGVRGVGAPGQPDDARVGDAALVDLALPALEGRVARHGPAPRVVVVAERAADLVDAAEHLDDAGAVEVGEAIPSLIVPSFPPSELAPLSDTSMTTVLSASPSSSMKSRSRPICASV